MDEAESGGSGTDENLRSGELLRDMLASCAEGPTLKMRRLQVAAFVTSASKGKCWPNRAASFADYRGHQKQQRRRRRQV